MALYYYKKFANTPVPFSQEQYSKTMDFAKDKDATALKNYGREVDNIFKGNILNRPAANEAVKAWNESIQSKNLSGLDKAKLYGQAAWASLGGSVDKDSLYNQVLNDTKNRAKKGVVRSMYQNQAEVKNRYEKLYGTGSWDKSIGDWKSLGKIRDIADEIAAEYENNYQNSNVGFIDQLVGNAAYKQVPTMVNQQIPLTEQQKIDAKNFANTYTGLYPNWIANSIKGTNFGNPEFDQSLYEAMYHLNNLRNPEAAAKFYS